MNKATGFKMGHKLVKVFKWTIHQRINRPITRSSSTIKAMTKLWGVPKGHLAVYVGEKEDDTHRYLVPVIYINHPLFGKLLEEAVNEYGFDHSGGIQIPCRISEFENVRTRIAAAGAADRRIRRGWRLR
ncbi:Auxin-responsive protein SAUR36 [Camellia lanceoleosa]|uniref:Auxin-responsive protein SAUR36 n=1 Tax=Camellia lanceoleosa TaxID=1840588 RepID=A0ACC0FJY5_9ERIC|nr:Auxin-responsive protein SAUR36 [Camellia lanceoleosa]